MTEPSNEVAGGVQVIGAGFGRTGTMSLKFALEKLGFGPCYHMREILTPRPGCSEGHLEMWSEHARARHADPEEGQLTNLAT